MTDNEIIKALECCNHNHVWQKECFDCEYATFEGQCGNELIKDSLDLINRQKAEIERLEGYNANLEYANQHVLYTLETEIKRAKSEAIREFAERLKATYPPREDKKCTLDDCYTLDVIDNLVKEMTEGGNDQQKNLNPATFSTA